jgi:hypothetical protein
MALAQLSIDLVAKIASFEADLKRAATATQQQTALMAGSFNAVKGAIGGLAGALSVGVFIEFAKRTIDSIDALNDLRDATGSSVENLSALEDIAARTGTTMDTVSAAMVKFNGVLKDAKPGSDGAAALKMLNLDLAELKQLDPAEALLKTATAFAGFADNGQKARIMQELFGKSLKDVAPFLKDLADKGELVAKVTTAQAEEAEKFNKQLFAMQKNVQDVSRDIAGPMMTAFNNLIDKTKEVRKYSSNPFNFVFNLGENYGRGGVAGTAGDTSARTGSWGDPVGRNPRLLRQGAYDKPTLDDIPEKDKKDKAAKKEGVSEESRALASYIEGLDRVIQKNDQLTEQEKALNFLRSIGATGEIAQVRELTLGMAAQVDAEKSLEERIKLKRQAVIDAGDAIAKSNQEYQALLARLYAATPTANTDAQRKDVLALTAEREAGRISEAFYLEAVTARLDLVADKTDKAKTAADEFGMTMASAFEDAIVGGKDLSGVINALGQDILRMTVRKAVTDPMAGFLSGALGSMFSGLPSFAVGTDYVPQDMVAKIHKGERIVPAAQNNGASSQPITVIQNFTVGDVASVSMVRQAVAGSERRIAAGINRSMTYGGAMA